MTTYIYALLAVGVVSLISMIGAVTLAWSEEQTKKNVFIFISLAVGALLGDALIHLIPEAYDSVLGRHTASILVVTGVLFFFVLEKFLHWHHHGEEEDAGIHPVGQLILLSDGIHNFIDGIILGTSFFVSIPVGIATTMAVILHEIPQEIGDFAVLLHSGYTRTRALWLNFASALSAVLGVGLAFLLRGTGERFTLWVLPIAAGGFIYIAVADLIPELHKTKELRHSIWQIIAVALGVLAMVGLLYIK